MGKVGCFGPPQAREKTTELASATNAMVPSFTGLFESIRPASLHLLQVIGHTDVQRSSIPILGMM
jgi:hypothetical protein